MMRRAIICLAACCALLAVVGAGPAHADSTQTSIMQDDQMLIDATSPQVNSALATMQQLGVETVRVNLEWNAVAPDPDSRTAPAGFTPGDTSARNPASYPSAGWSNYDRLVELAPLYGISVQFNITGPGPLWAMASGSPTARASTHWKPDAADFKAFVTAVATRYSGSDGLPRVSQWSIWNEPNQPGWLAPQWLTVRKRRVAQSPRLYRNLLDAGYNALLATGHSTRTDTILIGETAPEGSDTGGFYTAMTPIPFLRDLYCVTARDTPLRGDAAGAVGCPRTGSRATFVKDNAALFSATGYAHHPYDFLKSPSDSQKDPNMVPLSDISRLETFLNRTFSSYGVHRRIPLYFTEYGYETNPPDPHKPVTPAEQAAYLNEADYMSWKLPRVRTVAQFLLYDSAPNPLYKPSQYDYWDTFQTGLLYLNGTPKPSEAAYRMPIWMPTTHVRKAGSAVLVWGQVRPADRQGAQAVAIQFKAARTGTWKTVAVAHTTAETGYYTTHIKLSRTGSVRSVWYGTVGSTTASDAITGGFVSRSVAVVVTR